MISTHFVSWGLSRGRRVVFEQKVEGADKGNSLLKTFEDGMLLIPDPEEPEDNFGKADLMDVTMRHVYEIKHRPSAIRGEAEAEWYRWHLELDSTWGVFGRWYLGTDYLANGPVTIGPWPDYPEYEVRAELHTDGVITYWERKSRQQQPQDVPVPVGVPGRNELSNRQLQLQPAYAFSYEFDLGSPYTVVVGGTVIIITPLLVAACRAGGGGRPLLLQ